MVTNLDGRSTLITGASNETGAFMAEEFAKAGSDLALTYYSDEEGARQTAECAENHGVRVELYQLDLLDQNSIDQLVSDLRSDRDRLDVLVLSAGTVGLRNFEELSRDQLDTAVDGNFKGNFMLAKDLGYWMKETGGLGRIIQLTAQGAENTSHSAYGLAKSAQEQSDDFLAYHLAPEVTVNSLQPISIDQHPERDIGEDYDAPLGRKVHSREIARMALLLCDPVFDTVTGEVIRMDSGRHVVPAYPKDL